MPKTPAVEESLAEYLHFRMKKLISPLPTLDLDWPQLTRSQKRPYELVAEGVVQRLKRTR